MAKRKRKDPLAGLEVHIADLYRAVQNYVVINGGDVLVIGGVKIVQPSPNRPANLSIQIDFMGKPPVLSED